MALELKEKQLDDNDNPVKQVGGADDGKGSLTSNEADTFKEIADANPDIRALEDNPNTDQTNTTPVDSKEGGFYTGSSNNKKPKGLKGRFSRRQKGVAGVLAAILVGGGLYVSTLISGPLQLLQFANYLEKFHLTGRDSLTEGRLGNFYRYLKYQDSPEMRRVGQLARRSAANIEADFRAKGLNPVWQDGRLVRLDVNPNSVSALRAAGLDIPDSVDGRFRIDIDPPGTSASAARSNLKTVTKSLKSLDVRVGAIGMRSLRAKAGIGFLDTSIRRTTQNIRTNLASTGDARLDYEQRLQADIESDGTRLSVETRETNNTNPDNPTTNTETVDIDSDKVATKSKLQNAGKGIAVVGLVCAAYQITSEADNLRQANVIIPLMKFGVRFATASSQMLAGDVNLQAVGFLVDDLYDETAELGARSWKEALSIQENLALATTGVDIPRYAHPTQAGNFILQAFGTIPGIVGNFLDSTCGAIQSTAGQIIGYGVDLFTGGISAAAKGAIQELVLNQYADDLVAILAGKQVDTTVFKGALAGAGADWGMMLASRENMVTLGGRRLSSQEVSELNNYYASLEREDRMRESVFERYFALKNADSLAVTSLASLTDSFMSGNIFQDINPINTIAYTGKNFGSLLGGTATAQTPSYIYEGVDNVGFSLSELNDPRYQNPYENAAIAAPTLDENKDKIEKCYGLDLQTDGTLVPIGGAIKLLDEERDASCDDTSEEWTRIRFYVLDHSVGSSHDCAKEDSESCAAIGYEQSFVPQSNNTVSTIPQLTGPTIPCTGQPREIIRGNYDSASWAGITPTGIIGTNINGGPIEVFVRNACSEANVKTVVIVSSIHGSENGGQLVSQELLFNANLPPNIRVVAIPKLCACAGTGLRSANDVDLNRNYDYRWDGLAQTQRFSSGNTYSKGTTPESEPETQAMVNFLNSFTDINLFTVYHDNLNYIAPVGDTDPGLAQIFTQTTNMHGQCPGDNPSSVNCPIRTVNQRGSLDGWYNQQFNKPTLLVEWFNNPSDNDIKAHAQAIINVMEAVQ